MKLSKKIVKKLLLFQKVYLIKLFKKVAQVFVILRIPSGKNGNFQKEFKVYQRENLNCLRNKCTGKIKKIFISNRSTFFCNTCQK